MTDEVEAAIARARQAARDQHVAVFGAGILRQCLPLRLLDEVEPVQISEQ